VDENGEVPDSRVRICLKCGRSRGDSIFYFSIFVSLHSFFGIFKNKIGIYDPNLACGGAIMGIHSMGRRSLVFEGAHTNKTIGARFFYYEHCFR
jgi:hypothetical protein